MFSTVHGLFQVGGLHLDFFIYIFMGICSYVINICNTYVYCDMLMFMSVFFYTLYTI